MTFAKEPSSRCFEAPGSSALQTSCSSQKGSSSPVSVLTYMGQPMLQLPCTNYLTIVKKTTVELCIKIQFCPILQSLWFVSLLLCQKESPQTQWGVKWQLLPPWIASFVLLHLTREPTIMFLQSFQWASFFSNLTFCKKRILSSH